MQKLCCVCTRQQFFASLDYFVTSSPPYLHQFSTISGGNCIMHQSRRNCPQSTIETRSQQWARMKCPSSSTSIASATTSDRLQAHAPHALIFALGPGCTDLGPGCNNNVLDWMNVAHTKQHYKASAPLDITEKCNGQPGKICLTLSHVEDCTQQFSWSNILTIPVGATDYNLIATMVT